MPDGKYGYFEADPSLAGLSLYEAEQEGRDRDAFGDCCGGTHGPRFCHICECEHDAPRHDMRCLGEPGYGGIGSGDDAD